VGLADRGGRAVAPSDDVRALAMVPDAGPGQGITGSLERAQLGGAVGAPRSAVEQHDLELAGEPAWNLDGLRAGNVEGQRGNVSPGCSRGMACRLTDVVA